MRAISPKITAAAILEYLGSKEDPRCWRQIAEEFGVEVSNRPRVAELNFSIRTLIRNAKVRVIDQRDESGVFTPFYELTERGRARISK